MINRSVVCTGNVDGCTVGREYLAQCEGVGFHLKGDDGCTSWFRLKDYQDRFKFIDERDENLVRLENLRDDVIESIKSKESVVLPSLHSIVYRGDGSVYITNEVKSLSIEFEYPEVKTDKEKLIDLVSSIQFDAEILIGGTPISCLEPEYLIGPHGVLVDIK